MILKKQLRAGEIIEVTVVCNSKFQEISEITESKYKIKLKSQPVDGRANKELESYFKELGYSINILRGKKSNHKLVKVL